MSEREFYADRMEALITHLEGQRNEWRRLALRFADVLREIALTASGIPEDDARNARDKAEDVLRETHIDAVAR